MQDMRRSFSPKFMEICMETPRGTPYWAPTWRPETNRNICHWVLLQKRTFISRGTKKTIEKYFLQHKNCSDRQIPRNKSRNKLLFNQLSRHVNAVSRKILEIQAQPITKPRTHSDKNLYGYYFWPALIHHLSKIVGWSIFLNGFKF